MHPVSFLVLSFLTVYISCEHHKRALQRSHEKSQIDKWEEKFLLKRCSKKKNSLSTLVTNVINDYLKGCIPIIIYDSKYIREDSNLIDEILQKSEITVMHGEIATNFTTKLQKTMNTQKTKCISYILFVNDVIEAKRVLKTKTLNKVVIVTKSSQWRVNEFLNSDTSQKLINLLIIYPSSQRGPKTYVLNTHTLYADSLGSSEPTVLTSWQNNSFTRLNVNLFPKKLSKGFSGHRFITSLAEQPPFVIKNGYDESDNIFWDGTEIRLLQLLSERYNFTTDLKPAVNDFTKSPADIVIDSIKDHKSIVGMAGIYVTTERLENFDVTYPHSQDCAVFISLTSTALPRYRAILGPFHWSVWAALTSAYILVIFPLAFADKHTLMHLIRKPEEVENMFWYVFGTFTNSFTFGKESWTKSHKTTPRILMGFYWIFTTIITACYTGSIIAFITLPVYPITVDTVQQLLARRFQVGTLDKGGWERWFQNSSDPYTEKLMKSMEYIPDVESGLRNTTKAFFWSYAFLGSKAQLDYIVRTKFTATNKRQLLHISSKCFVPFGVSLIFEKNSEFKEIVDFGISNAVQSGFMIKFQNDIEWNMMRTATGKLLQANTGTGLRNIVVEDRSLTLDDTQGIFLLLGAGFLVGAAALVSEMVGGCLNFCKRRAFSALSLRSNPRIHSSITPREKLDSMQSEVALFPVIDDMGKLKSPDKSGSASFERELFGDTFLDKHWPHDVECDGQDD